MRNLDDSVIEDASEYDSTYFPGIENKVIRYYYYLNVGLGILNNFRNLFLGVFALYFTFHLTNPILLALMLIPGILILIAIGYYNTHTMSKVLEWISLRFSSHYAIRQFNYNQGQYELLKDIRELLEKKGV